MNRSISKMRHLQDVNRKIEKKYLIEQDEKIQNLTDFEITDNDSEVKDIDDVTVYGNKTKKLCDEVIDLMDDISDELEDCKESEDAKTQIEENVELNKNIKDLMKKLRGLIAVPFKNDNPFDL
jgi:hypothetical protein